MGYIMNLRKYVGHEPLIGLGATTLVFNEKKEILLNLRTDTNTWGDVSIDIWTHFMRGRIISYVH